MRILCTTVTTAAVYLDGELLKRVGMDRDSAGNSGKEDDAEDGANSFDNTMKSGTMQKLIKTPGSKSKKSKMAVTPKNRKASTTKSEDLKNHLKPPQSSKNDA